MLSANFFVSLGQTIVQIIGEVLYFPIWWYSVGFARQTKYIFRLWLGQEESLGFSVWAKNIFTPMYGQHDWSGRLISFFVRLVQVIGRGAVLLVLLVLAILSLLLWLVLPLAILFATAWQLIK